MNNINKAAEILIREGLFDAEAHCYAQALADAGLLMPDLPEPSLRGTWEDGRAVVYIDHEGYIVVYIDHEGYIVPDISARPHHPERVKRLALALLAAANHTERK